MSRTADPSRPTNDPDGNPYGTDPRCGTEAGYRAHSRRPGEESCPACRAAWARRTQRLRDADRDACRLYDRNASWRRKHGTDRPDSQENRWKAVQERRGRTGGCYNHPLLGVVVGPRNRHSYKPPVPRFSPRRSLARMASSTGPRASGDGAAPVSTAARKPWSARAPGVR